MSSGFWAACFERPSVLFSCSVSCFERPSVYGAAVRRLVALAFIIDRRAGSLLSLSGAARREVVALS